MKQKRKLGKKLLSVLLTLALVLGLMPGMGLTAYAAPTETLLTTITATGKEQANYSTANVATVSFSYTAEGSSAYLANWGWWGYGWTATVTAAEGYTITKCIFYDDANRTATDSEAPFVVETTEEDKTPQVNGTPISAYTSKGIKKIEVYGYATPAASYSVTVTAGDHMTKTTDSGAASQTGVTEAIIDVVYTANEGYYFPENYSVTPVNGISVTRNTYTQITVYGTPTADASITLTAPTAKTKPAAPTTAAAVDCTTADNNDGKLTGVTTAMEYKKSDATDWIVGTGSDITGLVPGTYYVRLKATDTTTASDNQELTIAEYTIPSYQVTYKVVNGTWSDDTTTDKTETVQSGSTPASVPTGMKAASGYTGGAWDTNPAESTITGATTFTYTFTALPSYEVTYKVVNGTWSDDTTTDKTETVQSGSKPASVPTGMKAASGYTGGAWDTDPTDATITGATTFTYTFTALPTYEVTYKVVNGTWSDDSTADKTENVQSGSKPASVPTGMKAASGYTGGAWDTDPSDATITGATTFTYTFTVKQVVATPTFSPEAGTYTETQSVTVSCATEGAEIHYTTDGSTPTASSSTYSSAITVNETTTIKAIAVKEGMTDSTVASATYTINIPPQTVATPAFSPEAGTYTEAQNVTISCATEGAEIHYTTDGSTPTASSSTYSSAITVNETTTIKAIAVKDGMTNSSVASATFTISDEPEPEPGEETKVDVEDLSDSDISDDLKGQGYDSVESIEGALETALSLDTEEQKEQSQLVDVKLMISTDGGATWTAATTANFPAGGIDVVLPYPAGTNGDEYTFSVAHMVGTTANGMTAGDIEKPGTTNTSSGISTHFNGLSPVMITWTKKSSPSKKDDSKDEEKAHTHHYVWDTIEATEENDGEMRYACDICGAVQTRVPITAYYVFNKNTTEKIRKAGQGATVKIETSRFISFHKMVMEALAERPDVTLEISFLDEEYKGRRLSVTIPAGTDAMSLIDENGFVGFLYLALKFGFTIL